MLWLVDLHNTMFDLPPVIQSAFWRGHSVSILEGICACRRVVGKAFLGASYAGPMIEIASPLANAGPAISQAALGLAGLGFFTGAMMIKSDQVADERINALITSLSRDFSGSHWSELKCDLK
eukprot:g35895.t1